MLSKVGELALWMILTIEMSNSLEAVSESLCNLLSYSYDTATFHVIVTIIQKIDTIRKISNHNMTAGTPFKPSQVDCIFEYLARIMMKLLDVVLDHELSP